MECKKNREVKFMQVKRIIYERNWLESKEVAACFQIGRVCGNLKKHYYKRDVNSVPCQKI